MTATVSDINVRAHVLLNEAGVPDASRRWTDAELFLWVTDAQREIGQAIPSAISETTTLTLIAGPRQTIPPRWDKLLRVVRNTNGPTIRTTSAAMVRNRTTPLTLNAGQQQSIPSHWEVLNALWQNEGGAEIRKISPEEIRFLTEDISLTPGALQTVPSHFAALTNLASKWGTCRFIDKASYDAASPGWLVSLTPSATPNEWMYQPTTDKRRFWVSPPAAVGTTVTVSGMLVPGSVYSGTRQYDYVDEYLYAPERDPRIFWVVPAVNAGTTVLASGALTFEAWYSDAGNTATIVEEWFYHPTQDRRTFYVNPGVAEGVQIEAIGHKIVPPVLSLTDALLVPGRFISAVSLYVAHRAMQKQVDYALGGIANAFIQEYAASIKLAETTEGGM